MAEITVQIGDDESVVDLAVDSMTLNEHERLQRQVGNRAYDQFLASGEILVRPDFLKGLLYAKVATAHPDIEPDDIDVDFVALVEAINALVEESAGKALDSA